MFDILNSMNFSSKRILVTGGAGYIGSHVGLALKPTQADVAIIDNLSTGFKENIAYGTLTELDLNDWDATHALIAEFKPHAIIHFAGSIVVPESVANPIKYYQNNTANSLNLIQCAAQHDVAHFLFHPQLRCMAFLTQGTAVKQTPYFPLTRMGDPN